MKSLIYAMVISLSAYFVVGICSNVGAEPIKTPDVSVDLESPNPGTQQDDAITPMKEAELEIKGVKLKYDQKRVCKNETFIVMVRVANNGGKKTSFRILNPHPTSQIYIFNILANQDTEFEAVCKSSGVVKDNHVSAYIYLANPLSGNPQCEKYGTSQSGNWFCDSDMTNQKVTIKLPYGNDAQDLDGNYLLCPEQITKIQAAPENKISVISSMDFRNTVTVKLKSKVSEPSRLHLIEIKSPRNGKIIWSKSIPLPAGTKTVKIDHKDLDLKSQTKGKMPYQLLIDQNMVGTVFIDNKVNGGKIEKQPVRSDGAEQKRVKGSERDNRTKSRN